MASSRQDPGYEVQYLRSVKKKKRKAVCELLKSRKTLGEYATIVRQMYEDPDGRVFFECFRMSRARVRRGVLPGAPTPPHFQGGPREQASWTHYSPFLRRSNTRADETPRCATAQLSPGGSLLPGRPGRHLLLVRALDNLREKGNVSGPPTTTSRADILTASVKMRSGEPLQPTRKGASSGAEFHRQADLAILPRMGAPGTQVGDVGAIPRPPTTTSREWPDYKLRRRNPIY
ncbi:hypothetical protein HPB47_000917 [Ixodes persulcatus]|uniref:Uncharacterized protein n=1 Tax=Ixodes persulcatus TaxID=34615 RepID=A0AC60PRZ6_IXOPE|nr:hypothetical protein HPB47_000917 [Ixodes persulcatus]